MESSEPESSSESAVDRGIVSTVDTVLDQTVDGVRTINEFTIVEELGQGSFGKVYKGHDGNTEWAIKVFSKSKLNRRIKTHITSDGVPGPITGLEEVYDEISALTVLTNSAHRHGLEAYQRLTLLREVLDDDVNDCLCLVLQLGGDVLLDWDGARFSSSLPSDDYGWVFSKDLVCKVAKQLMQVVALFQRWALEPENVLLDKNGDIKVTDFGSAQLLEWKSECNDCFGMTSTLAFACPESVRSSETLDPYNGFTADLWSVGVTIYAMVFGTLPYSEDNVEALLDSIENSSISFPYTDSVLEDTGLHTLMTCLLNKDPEQRMQVCQLNWEELV